MNNAWLLWSKNRSKYATITYRIATIALQCCACMHRSTKCLVKARVWKYTSCGILWNHTHGSTRMKSMHVKHSTYSLTRKIYLPSLSHYITPIFCWLTSTMSCIVPSVVHILYYIIILIQVHKGKGKSILLQQINIVVGCGAYSNLIKVGYDNLANKTNVMHQLFMS